MSEMVGLDVFLYSGAMRRGSDLRFIERVHGSKRHDRVLLVLCTLGGDPDAAYKIGRYLQYAYDDVSILVAGLCKSAGTLLALAANEVIFTPYGELGPLDIQLTKTDHVAAMESGLSILQAFETLQAQAKATYHNIVQEIISTTGGIVSFQTASHSASEIISSLYGPIFSRIDPEEVGSRTRAMQIAAAYGRRLDVKFKNLKGDALDILAQTYPSHTFVIDLDEAKELLNRARSASDAEKSLVKLIGVSARFPSESPDIKCLTDDFAGVLLGEANHDDTSEHSEGEQQRVSGTSSDDAGDREGPSEGSVTSDHTPQEALAQDAGRSDR